MSKFIYDIDLNQNQLQNAVIQSLSTAPSNPKEGQIYYDTTDKNIYRFDGTSWVTYQSELETTATSTLSIDSTPTNNSSNLVTSGGVYTALQNVDSLPDQTGQSGKYLTTNGTDASWENVLSYSFSNGLTESSSTVYNTGVLNVEASPSTASNGTVAVIKGTSEGETSTSYVAVKGLGSAAYTDSSAYLPSSTTIPTAYTSNPAMDGTASPGSSSAYAKGDHVHPSDTSKQATITASGILKGDGSGGVTAATAGTDYVAPSALSDYMQKGVDYVTAGQKANTTLGTQATAEGEENTASGAHSHAEGFYTTASSSAAHAEGSNTIASGGFSHAEGDSATASGHASHAEGVGATAAGYSSHAEGRFTIANGAYQHVFGTYNIEDEPVVFYPEENAKGTYIEIVGNGSFNDSSQTAERSNARTLDWSGNEVLAGKLTVGAGPTENMDVATKQYVDNHTPDMRAYMQKGVDYVTAGQLSGSTLGSGATAEGYGNTATANYSHAEGYSTTASGARSHAEGSGSIASAYTSHAEGSSTKAIKDSAHAEGHHTRASGYYSHAEGSNSDTYEIYLTGEANATTYTVNSSSIETEYFQFLNQSDFATFSDGQKVTSVTYNGDTLLTITVDSTLSDSAISNELYDLFLTNAAGYSSHSEGGNSHAVGQNSHAEGTTTLAGGNSSHAEGFSAVANGIYSHAEGVQTIAQRRSQHVFGEYNVLDTKGSTTTKGKYVEIVGKGTSTSERSNARTLDWSGNEVLAGKLTVGAGPTADMDVATKQYVDSKETPPSDYDADEGEAGHILNRPFYTEVTESSRNRALYLLGHADELAPEQPYTGEFYPHYDYAEITPDAQYFSEADAKSLYDYFTNTPLATILSECYIDTRDAGGSNVFYASVTNVESVTDDDTGNPAVRVHLDDRNSEGAILQEDSSLYIQKYSDDNHSTHLYLCFTEEGQALYPSGTTCELAIMILGTFPEQVVTVHQLDSKYIGSDIMRKGVDYVTAGQRSGTTLGSYATAEGANTTASGYISHAEGAGTTASGSHSHSEGNHTVASGNYSHAEGYNTTAQRKSQHVFGEYNVLDTTGTLSSRGKYVEIVGNGTFSARSNARTLDWSGNEVLAGKLTVGAGPTENMDVATKTYVDTAISSGVPVTSVNTKTGAVSLTASDVGALPDSTDVTMWNGVSLAKQSSTYGGNNTYVPATNTLSPLNMSLTKYTYTPTANAIAKYDASSYLYSTTPSASDNSTKVATTAYVDAAIPSVEAMTTSDIDSAIS